MAMMQSYSSPYPNYLHQLFITPSKHLHVLKDGRLKWQDKAMDVALEGIDKSDRENIVHYIVSDHTSSAFYAEMHTSRSLVSPKDFLIRAWSEKPNFFFCGVPKHLVVPAVVMGKFPEVGDFLDRQGVIHFPPSSGFYAGVHQVRNWEKDVASVVSFHNYLEKTPCTAANIAPGLARALEFANDREINRPGVRLSRKQLWCLPVEGKPAHRGLV